MRCSPGQTPSRHSPSVPDSAVDVLHGDVRRALDFAEDVDAAHVAMGNLPRDPHLATETLDEIWAVAFGLSST